MRNPDNCEIIQLWKKNDESKEKKDFVVKKFYSVV